MIISSSINHPISNAAHTNVMKLVDEILYKNPHMVNNIAAVDITDGTIYVIHVKCAFSFGADIIADDYAKRYGVKHIAFTKFIP